LLMNGDGTSCALHTQATSQEMFLSSEKADQSACSGFLTVAKKLKLSYVMKPRHDPLLTYLFYGYPSFQPVVASAPSLTPSTRTVSELPEVHSEEDWLSLITRLRMTLEDPRQLLSNCVADYAVAQLCAYSNQPARVPIPGLTGVSYSTRQL